MNKQHIELDISKYGNGKCIRVGQGDVGGTTIEALVYDNGSEFALSGATVSLVAVLPNKRNYYRGQCSTSGNTATITVDESKLCSVAGYTDEAYFTIKKGDNTYSTERFAIEILRSALDGTPAHSWDDVVQDTIDNVKEAINEANKATSNALTATDEAHMASQSAHDAALRANDQAKLAQSAAQQAQAAAKLAKPYHIQDAEPPRSERVQGAMWVQTEGPRVKSVNKWDESLPGLGLYPGADTNPGAESCPGQAGDWHRYTV